MHHFNFDIKKLFLIIIICILCISSLISHPLSISWGKLNIYYNKVEAEIIILAEDLFLFHQIKPDTNHYFDFETLSKAAQIHKDSLSSWLYIENDLGKKLNVSFANFREKDIPEKIHKDSLLNYKIHYFLDFEINKKVDLLKVFLAFGGRSTNIPSIMMLGVTLSDFDYYFNGEISSGQPCIIYMDSENPQNYIRNNNLYSFPARNNKTISSEIKITDHEVTMEIKLEAQILETIVVFEKPIQNYSMSELRILVSNHFSKNIHTSINDSPTEMTNCWIIHPEINTKLTPAGNHKITIIFSFKSNTLIESLALQWDCFTWKHQILNSAIDLFGTKESFKFTRFQPTYNWNRINYFNESKY